MGLTKIAIQRPVFVLMLMLAVLLIGNMSLQSMRLEQNPDVAFGNINIITVYPGAGPEEVAELVSRKLEEAVSGVNGLREVTSSSQEGVSIVNVQLELGTDVDVALNDLRSKVDAVLNELPDDIERPTITKIDSGSQPVIFYSLSSKTMSVLELRDLADKVFADRFAQLAGVGAATATGGDQREIQIQIRPDRLSAYGIGAIDVLNAVRSSSQNLPAGRIVQGDQETSVRVRSDFTTLKDVQGASITVRDQTNPNSQPKMVPLADVATIKDASVERRSYSRLGGEDSVVLVIQKSKEGNAVQISHAATDLVKQLGDQYGVTFTKTFDQATIIESSVEDLVIAIIVGIVLVTAIVYIFLHDFRGMLIVAIAIPLCIFATFIAMNIMGFTLNNMSLLAVSLAVGVLVDDAIVVLENIYRHLKMGEDPRDAALNGRAEIGLAAIAIALADVVVFLPIGFMGGIVGQFFRPLALSFAACVLVSLLVSFVVTPMLASRWYRKGEDVEHAKGWFAVGFEKGFGWFTNGYRRVLEWALAHRWFVFITGAVVLFAVFMFIAGSFAPNGKAAMDAGTPLLQMSIMIGAVVLIINLLRKTFRPIHIFAGLLFGLVFPAAAFTGFQYAQWKKEAVFKFGFMPDSDGAQVQAEIQLPPGSSLEATQRIVERVEDVVKKHPDVEFVLSQVGTLGSGGFGDSGSQGSQYARVTASLYDKRAIIGNKPGATLRTRSDKAVASDLVQSIGRVPGATVKVSAANAQGFGAPIQISFSSADRNQAIDTAASIKRRLDGGAVAGVINADISSKPGKPELRLVPDRTRLANYGLTVADVAATMRLLYEGDDSTKLRVRGEEYPIRVMMDTDSRNDSKTLAKIPIKFSNGNAIYLDSVVTTVPGTSPDKIDRRNRAEEVRLTADLLDGFAPGSVQAQIDSLLAKENLVPEGVTMRALGQADATNREMGFLLSALGLGFLLVYMLLASLYDNLLYPLIIQLAQPQAFVGALMALIITDRGLNIVGFIGLICLVGLVGKNAILLVDYTNTLRARGRSRHDALVEAGPIRLRPIMMTTLALILGMLPVALAIGRGSEFRETIGIIIIGGISLSTILTLVVIPCSYTILDDASIALGKLLNRNRDKDDPTHRLPTGPPELETAGVGD